MSVGNASVEEAANAPRWSEYDERPWGHYAVLDEGDGYKVKRIVVNAGKRLSYQLHAHRHEHWFVVQGEACVTLDGRVVALKPGQAIDIPAGTPHRIENPGDGPLVFIEVQRGAYLGEDDITRLQDDYGRAALA
jgi:mannose-6-phosphate isomerase-like protein (cupin superfamily)